MFSFVLKSLFAAAVVAGSNKSECELAGKPDFCAAVTAFIDRTNQWVCRDCFNVRVNFKLSNIGTVGAFFDNRDFVYIAFDTPVELIKYAGPVGGATQMSDLDGNPVWKIGFENTFEIGDGKIDFNIGKIS